MKRFLALLAAVGLLVASDATLLQLGPPILFYASGTYAAVNASLNAAGYSAAIIFQAREAADITTLLFRVNAITGTIGNHKVSLQTVSATTGYPDGTVVACGKWTPGAESAVIVPVTITHNGAGGSISSYAVTRGGIYSLVVEPCPDATAPCGGAVTPDGSNYVSVSYAWENAAVGSRWYFPYAGLYTGSWARGSAELPLYGMRSATKTYGFPIQTLTYTSISSGDEQGISFTLPTGWGNTFEVSGTVGAFRAPAASKDVKMVLYTGTTNLQAVTIDGNQWRSNASMGGVGFFFTTTTLSTLSFGNTYRIGLSPQDASNNFALYYMQLATAGDRTAFPGGANITWTSRTGCGAPCDTTSTAWTDDNTRLPLIGIRFADWTEPTGSGGAHACTFVCGN